MQNYLLTSAIVVSSAVTAHAGNISEPVTAPVIEAPNPVQNWAGGYAGANLSWGDADVDDNTGPGPAFKVFSPDGMGGAARAGYDWQFSKVVIGLGAEYNFGKIEGDGISPATGFDANVTDAAMAFGRVGYDAGNFMPYALIGHTWADLEIRDLMANQSFKDDIKGATFGAGIEGRLAPNWSIYGEYTYTDFGTSSMLPADIDTDMNLIKVGVNYQF